MLPHSNAKIYCLNWDYFHSKAELVPSSVLMHLAPDISVLGYPPELEISRVPQHYTFPGGHQGGRRAQLEHAAPRELCHLSRGGQGTAHRGCHGHCGMPSALRAAGAGKYLAPGREWST